MQEHRKGAWCVSTSVPIAELPETNNQISFPMSPALLDLRLQPDAR